MGFSAKLISLLFILYFIFRMILNSTSSSTVSVNSLPECFTQKYVKAQKNIIFQLLFCRVFYMHRFFICLHLSSSSSSSFFIILSSYYIIIIRYFFTIKRGRGLFSCLFCICESFSFFNMSLSTDQRL